MLRPYLEDLEARIDVDVEQDLLDRWTAFTDGRSDTPIFSPGRSQPSPPTLDWPRVLVNEALANFDAMALQQLKLCSDVLAGGSGRLLCVRANYGTGILPSIFDAEPFMMDDALDTLPTNRPLAGGHEAIAAIINGGPADLHRGLGGMTLEMGQRLIDMLGPYPRLRRFVHVYHPDLQGPMDVVELLWGSGLFLDLVDVPEMVAALLDRVTDTYIAFMREWDSIVPPLNGHPAHWSFMHKGHVVLRDDSAMNVSPAMFDEFIRPYDQRILDTFGGGVIHFCGRGEHFLPSMCQMARLYGIQLSQPEYNDMEAVYRVTVDRGIKLLGLDRATADAAVAAGRDLHGQVHCW